MLYISNIMLDKNNNLLLKDKILLYKSNKLLSLTNIKKEIKNER